MEETQLTPQQKESIKLMKMSKGYNWEIKLMGEPELKQEILERLDKLDKEMRDKYGN